MVSKGAVEFCKAACKTARLSVGALALRLSAPSCTVQRTTCSSPAFGGRPTPAPTSARTSPPNGCAGRRTMNSPPPSTLTAGSPGPCDTAWRRSSPSCCMPSARRELVVNARLASSRLCATASSPRQPSTATTARMVTATSSSIRVKPRCAETGARFTYRFPMMVTTCHALQPLASSTLTCTRRKLGLGVGITSTATVNGTFACVQALVLCPTARKVLLRR